MTGIFDFNAVHRLIRIAVFLVVTPQFHDLIVHAE
jgi:hypothetical protein